MVIKVGVLELQGNFSQHHHVFEKLGIESVPIKNPLDLDLIDGLVIPGGESTTISLLIDSFELRSPLKEFGRDYPIMGTCAGLILLAKKVEDKRVNPLGLLDIVVDRNAYGRQIESSTEMITYHFNNLKELELPTTFIRAPKISKVGDNVQILGEFDGFPVAAISLFSQNEFILAYKS